MPKNIFIALGSNIEPRKDYLLRAIERMKIFSEVLQISTFIETEPMGFEADTCFLNAVVEIESDLPPLELLLKLQCIEKVLGRKMKSINKQYASRTIDLDLLYYDQTIIITPDLIIPHREIFNRDFVVIPLMEIAPNFVDPLLMKSIGAI